MNLANNAKLIFIVLIQLTTASTLCAQVQTNHGIILSAQLHGMKHIKLDDLMQSSVIEHLGWSNEEFLLFLKNELLSRDMPFIDSMTNTEERTGILRVLVFGERGVPGVLKQLWVMARINEKLPIPGNTLLDNYEAVVWVDFYTPYPPPDNYPLKGPFDLNAVKNRIRYHLDKFCDHYKSANQPGLELLPK